MSAAGARIFRWRSYLPLVIAPGIVAVAMAPETPIAQVTNGWRQGFCILVATAGVVARILIKGSVPRGSSGRNTKRQKASVLNRTGLYSIVRNPLYLANGLIWLAVVVCPGDPWFAVASMLLFVLYYERVILAEERFLEDRFGEEYLVWARRTPAILPRWSGWTAAEQEFSPRAAIRSEYGTPLQVVLWLMMIDTVGRSMARGSFAFSTGWSIALAVTGALWIVVRYLKKRTGLLRVPRLSTSQGS